MLWHLLPSGGLSEVYTYHKLKQEKQRWKKQTDPKTVTDRNEQNSQVGALVSQGTTDTSIHSTSSSQK